MCYVGGPRCSDSAIRRYNKAKERYANDPTDKNKEQRRQAYNEFLLTPKGIQHLAEWKAKAEQDGEEEQVDAVDTLLRQATKKRDQLLENNKRRTALKNQLWRDLKDYPEKDDAFKILSKEGKHANKTPLFSEVREFAHSVGYKGRMPQLTAQDYYAFSNLKKRMDQQRVVAKAEAVELSEPGSQAHLYPRYADGGVAEVYYASYGSNLSRKRLMTYIEGGKPTGGNRTYSGCEDKSPPQDDIPLKVPHPLHFALNSSVWKGGIGFVDSDSSHKSLGRAYLISSEQFEDIVSQESNVPLGQSGVDLDKTIKHTRVKSSSKAYGTLVHIGDYNGRPVMTFTNKHSIQDSLSERKKIWSAKTKKHITFRAKKPSDAYLRMISSGLTETFNMSKEDQVTYFRGSLGCENIGLYTLKHILKPEPKKTYSSSKPSKYFTDFPKDEDEDIENMTLDEWHEYLARDARKQQNS